MTLNKHAYLIIAHNEFELLENLVEVLDDERNDIYIHMDLKSEINEDYKKKFDGYKSMVYFIERNTINWGGFTQIQCEINLLKAATKRSYAYYHLLSGVDFPLKDQNEIHTFFEQNKGKEFIHFSEQDIQKNLLARVKFYYFLQDINFFTKNKLTGMIRNKTNLFLNQIQKLIGIDRITNSDITYMKGANWFSITDDFAKYVVSQEEWIAKIFGKTLCGDEFFLQTLIYNSPFKENLYSKEFDDDYLSIMRYIDWEKGNPYTWRTGDLDILKNSPYLFARKFSSKIDNELINQLKASLSYTKK